MSISKVKHLIIGSGPTGIGAAYRLKELGENDFLVLEKSDRVGGLATSYQDQKGFTWDIGGHVQFSHYPYFDKAMEIALGPNGWLHHQRESWVWLKNRFIPYPFQNNIHRLSQDDCRYCLDELKKITESKKKKPHNFKEWLEASFGKGICELFLFPYNFKVWAYPAELLNYNWIGERVSVVDVKRIQENIKFNKDDVSWGPNNTFQFPKNGGTGAIWSSLSEKIGITYFQLKNEVKLIDQQNKVVHLQDGQKIVYQNLLSTMPLNVLTQKIPALNEALVDESQKLVYSSTNIVGIGVSGKLSDQLKTKCWMYFPESDCPFYRVTVFSNYSPSNVPDIQSQFSLMTEISESAYRNVDQEQLVSQVIEGLYACKLLSEKDQIVSSWQFNTKYGYPTPSLGRDKILRSVIPELQKDSIWSRGRFGGWKYEVSNQDHSFMQGVEWVNLILKNEPESTYQL